MNHTAKIKELSTFVGYIIRILDYLSFENLVGYAASFFVVASFLVKNNIGLTRMINLTGAILFIFYGYLIHSLPVIIPNALLTIIQLYYLILNREN